MANNSQYPGIQPPRPPVAPMGPPQSTYPSVSMQFRPAGPPRPPPPYMPMAAQQFLPVGIPNIVLQSQPQQLQLSQPVQLLPPRPGPPVHTMVPPPPPPPAAQPFSLPDGQPGRPILSVSPQAQHAIPVINNYVQGPNGPRVALSVTYNPSTSATAQVHMNAETASQYQPILLPSFPLNEQKSVAVTTDPPKAVEKVQSDWIEHTTRAGKRFYHNKKTKVSTWEKPLDLMTLIERADASTDWRECKAPNGRKYYYNKVTRQSKWRIPEELELARERMNSISSTEEQEPKKVAENEPVVPSATSVRSSTPNSASPSSRAHEPVSGPVQVAPLIAPVQSGSVLTSELSTESSKVLITSEETVVHTTLLESAAPSLSNTEDVSAKDSIVAENGISVGTVEESEKGTATNTSTSAAHSEEKPVENEPQVYENKQEAKNAFKLLLETANVASDWTWDQAMRVIINDKRYGALRTLGERKQTFLEFVGQKKKQEVEERRNKQRKAREEFKKMLEESKEVTSSTKWSKVVTIFEDDDRFIAVERSKDREDLFDDHIAELEKKERAKALEELKKNKKEYINFLKSCDFLTGSSQWRRVQDRLEADESCMRLEKVDRFEIFQEYIRDLEREEEEQRKLRMEELRKTERKNRDEFRKLMEGHIASGMITPKTHWRDYCIKVKDLPPYVAVSSNSTGATPKALFEDVIEELEKQYHEDRDQIKEAVKMRKVSMSSAWTLEEFKNAIAEDITTHPVSDVNLKLVFDELQERVREREEKEAKRRKRITDDFYLSLTTSKEITSSSRWEDFKPLFQIRQENWLTVEENIFKEIFDKHITELKKAREERKHREDKAKKSIDTKDRDRRTDKSRRSKDRSSSKKDKHRKGSTDSENGDRRDNKDKKHRKRHQTYSNDMNVDEDDKDRSRDSHRHNSSERKRTKQVDQHSSVSVEYESRHKRYKRDHRRGGEYNDQKEAEDGEVWPLKM